MKQPLWHYTCDHGLAAITRSGFVLKPNALVTPTLLWLTDLPEPDRRGLGLTMRLLKCDRTAHRFAVPDPIRVEPWAAVRRLYRPTYVESLEGAPGALPEHWYVTTVPQQARLEEIA